MAIIENGLSYITVLKISLLEALKKNREQHRSTFLEAQKGYREAVIRELDSMLSDARTGKNFRVVVSLVAPSDHTRDYDKVIRMLEMSVKDEIQITDREFSHYVLDDWGWKQDFIETSSAYVGARSR